MADTTEDLLPEENSNSGNIIPINIEDEMRGAYIDYSMSVIVSRALPDVRDGLKPVHRRVLYGMEELGVNYNRPYKKSARIVGEVLGKYHPHGDSSVYFTMVRMAQEWSLRYPLVDGQGNFGSIDGDSPAAMRYTEARLKRIAEEMLADLNKDTVDFQNNFDDSLKEPTVLPAKIPNLLLNGSAGIAVGMATNMAPHNLSEIVDGITAYIDNPEVTVADLMHHVKGPDFPTGGTIYGLSGIRSAFETGQGRVVIRANATFEQTKTGKDQIVITDMPYQVNKAVLQEKIAELVESKKLEGISAIRDESSNREGIRLVIELKKEAVPNVVLNNLYKHTPLQTAFSVNNVALVKGRPMTLNLKDLIRHYVDHRLDVIVRRTKFDLKENRKRAHILEGLLVALDHLDAVITLIRASRDPEVAKQGLMNGDFMSADQKTAFLANPNRTLQIVDTFQGEDQNFVLSEAQAKAILEMRLQRLTGLERDKIVEEHAELLKVIADLEDILARQERRYGIIKDDLAELKARFGDERRTQISHADDELSIEDMIADEEMLITISSEGYVKRTALSEYRTQSRGGVGARGVKTKDTDFTEHLFTATMHNYLLFFTDAGRCFWMRVFNVPEGNKTAKGRPIQNLLNIESGEKIRAVINVKTLSDPDYINNNFIVMCTQQGIVKKTSLEAYSRPRQNGIIAVNINEGDRLLDVALTNGSNEIIIAVDAGRAVRFNEAKVRPMGRTATGVKGVELADDEKVIGMVCVTDPATAQLLVVSEQGYGKRSDIEDYRLTNRGAKGVTTLKVTDKTGKLVAIKQVTDNDDLMIINKSGIAIRFAVADLRVMGRNTQGVRLISLRNGDEISSITKIEKEEEDPTEGQEEGDAPATPPEATPEA